MFQTPWAISKKLWKQGTAVGGAQNYIVKKYTKQIYKFHQKIKKLKIVKFV